LITVHTINIPRNRYHITNLLMKPYIDIDKHQTTQVISGIGCSTMYPSYLNVYQYISRLKKILYFRGIKRLYE
jgi:hypothetical protein